MALSLKHTILATNVLPKPLLLIIFEYGVTIRDLLLHLPCTIKEYDESEYPCLLHNYEITNYYYQMLVAVEFTPDFQTIAMHSRTIWIFATDDELWKASQTIANSEDPIEDLLTQFYNPCEIQEQMIYQYYEIQEQMIRVVASRLVSELLEDLSRLE